MVNSKRGVTLVELLVVIVISTIVLSLAYQTYQFFISNISRSKQFGVTQQDAYKKVQMITSTIRRSDAVLELSPQSITLLNGNDTVEIIFEDDTLFRIQNSELPKPWFSLQSFELSSPPHDTGWALITVSALYDGHNGSNHRISQDITIFRKPINVENDWGF